MSGDIEDILARHLYEEGSWSVLCPQTHKDRAALLIFISRQNEKIQRLREELRRIAAIDTYSRRTWIMAVKAAREALKEDGR